MTTPVESRRQTTPRLRVLLMACALGCRALAESQPDPAQLEFFESRIRPVLVEACYQCHSTGAGKSKGGLLLDSRDALRKGGDTGPAIVPGDPEKSLLIRAVRHAGDDVQMPPASAGGKLAAAKIADLEHWVGMGAPDPRTANTTPKPGVQAAFERAGEHWAFQPIRQPALPVVQNRRWGRTPVDAFVLARLEANGLKPAPAADPRTRLRRVYFDLLGLPPTPAETAAFLADTSPDAWERVVERLLASPHYGERWGRYWLDVARYADTKGYVFQEERRYAFSHTYRDYVIRAFNEDLPFDRFLVEQIAADQLPLGEDKRALAAMGFLTLGRRFLNDPNDIIDDRLDVVVRGTMALTIGCARCHDHKFDPLTVQDYYGLHGVFASSEEPVEKPLLGPLRETADYAAFLGQRSAIEARQEAEIQNEVQKWRRDERARTPDYLLAAHAAAKLPAGANRETFAGERKVTPRVLDRWIGFLTNAAARPDPVFAPWFAFGALPETGFTEAARELSARLAADGAAPPLNPQVRQAFAGTVPASLKDVAAIYGRLFEAADQADAKTGGADAALEAVRLCLHGESAPPNVPEAEVRELIARHLDNVTVKYRQEIEALNWTHPGAPARGMVMTDRAQPQDSRVFIRGNPGNPGAPAPRRFLEVLAGRERKPFAHGSGRLELAEAITRPDNPLTARVLVNRVWGWHFGTALVRTPSDFGVRTEPPVQRELLDWLAASFVERGWSVKQLHRLIVNSSTYLQASEPEPAAGLRDPENQLLHHFNRRRLDFEAMRDTLLAASGALDPAVGGLPVDITQQPPSGRRTVYGFIDRQNLPGLFRTFDFASPDTSSAQRFATTVPQQALFMLNSPFVVEQARRLLKREELASLAADADRLDAMYRLLFQRPPRPDERALAHAFLRRRPVERTPDAAEAWQYGYGRFDAAANATVSFIVITNAIRDQLTPAPAFPDADPRGYLCVTATGGHPGNTAALASIRRWVAPADGVLRLQATLGHANARGDGVRARLVSSRAGQLGEWRVHNGTVPTPLEERTVITGETLDFVVDCLGGPDSDSFTWAPTITLTSTTPASPARREWSAERDFDKRHEPIAPVTRWEQLAQALLVSNELMFVD